MTGLLIYDHCFCIPQSRNKKLDLVAEYQTCMVPECYSKFTAEVNEGDQMNQKIGTMVYGEMVWCRAGGQQNMA